MKIAQINAVNGTDLRFYSRPLTGACPAGLQVGSKVKINGYYDDHKFLNEGKWLYPTYCRWCNENGHKPIASRFFTKNLNSLAREYAVGGIDADKKMINNKSYLKNITFWDENHESWYDELCKERADSVTNLVKGGDSGAKKVGISR